ncbi:MAG: hypothetical protein RI973_282 [Bacteroidota bacterium]|jgi:outer membrane protein OmpA-like peptidoglycan-associated protein
MKKSLFSLAVLFLPLCLAMAQQQTSKSKSADKVYEKTQILDSARLINCSDLNTASHEFSPAFYQNGIVYVSYHKSGPVDPKTGKPFFELFYAEVDDLGLPQKGRPFSLTINSQAHEGPVSFSRENDVIYFTRNSLEDGLTKANSQGMVPMKIYEARRGKYDWEQIRSLPFNNDEYSCFHPALSADGKRLFFSSNMPGGYGGFDLYFVQKKGDDWSKPVNLGKDVNSAGNEVFPFIHKSGNLFYSSNGWGGEGKLDVYAVDVSGSDWNRRIHLGKKINSAEDDFGFILNDEGTRGYLTSGRAAGQGEDDIYLVEVGMPFVEEKAPLVLNTTIITYDSRTNERIGNAGVRVFLQSDEGVLEGNDLYDLELLPSDEGQELLVRMVRKSDGQLGSPSLYTNLNGEALTELLAGKNYLVLITKEGYQSSEFSFGTEGLEGPQILRAPMKPKSCITLNGLVTAEGFAVPIPNALIRIVNQTDNSEKLVRSSSSGMFEGCLDAGGDFVLTAEKPGYEKATYSLTTKGKNDLQPMNQRISMKPLSDEVLREPIQEGSVIVLEKIYYDYNQYIIRKGAARDLDALARLMTLYPSMEIELVSHTDSRGTEEYNLDLSLKRAESARRYLVQKGIGVGRIKVFGYGESQIRNKCLEGVECTEEEHQFNRRTEVRVVRIDEAVPIKYGEGNPSGGDGN